MTMNIIPAFGLILPDFYVALSKQINGEVLHQTLIEYIAKRPQDWVPFAFLVVPEFKENCPEKEDATFDAFLGYLRQQYSIDLKLDNFSLADVTHISERLLK